MPSFQCSVSMVDAYNRPVTKRFEISATDQAGAMTKAGALMTDFSEVTEARILSYTVAEKVVYTDSVTAGANRDEGATISVRTADNGQANITIPAPMNTIFNADGTVDLTDTAFAAFIANYLSGDVLVDDGETVAEVIRGWLDK